MQFDNRSLVVALGLVSLLCATARFLLHRMHPAMPGLALWAWASAIGACALFLFAAQSVQPALLTGTVPQALMVVGMMTIWIGFRRFLARPPLSRAVTAGLVVGMGLPIVLAHVTQSLEVRAQVSSALLAVGSGMIARELLVGAPGGRVALRATGWVYVLNGLFFLGRFLTLSLRDGPLALQSDVLTSVALLWMLCVMVSTTLGTALMAGERLQEELNQQISRDPLTGALNRRAFGLIAEKAVALCRRQHKALSLLVMDLDHFKQINDRHGHAVGDRYLCRFVALAGRALRGEDVLCRFGGEEFVALMPGADASQALAAAERLRAAFAADIVADPDLPFPATVSIGVAALREGESLEHLLQRADSALYHAKHQGRDRVHLAEGPAAEGGASAFAGG